MKHQTTNNETQNTSYRLPQKSTDSKNKAITIALVCIYVFVALFIIINK